MSLAAADLGLAYPGKQLFRAVNAQFQEGQCWAVMGPNGAGKSSLLHALAGLLSPTDGQIMLDDQPLAGLARRRVAGKIGLLPQVEEDAFSGTVREYVAHGRYPHLRGGWGWSDRDEGAVADALAAMELTGLAGRTLATLSGGERQRVRLALLLAQQPDIYLLDEPLMHLDLGHQATVMRHFQGLARSGRIVVMVLHEPLWAARYCDHALLLYDDGIAENGSTGDLLRKEALERLYRCPMRMVESGNERWFAPE
jgi:iron complex transport system ATP-binding protein